MIKGEPAKLRITKQEVFNIISPFDVYMRFFGKFVPNVPVCNHLRGEDDPSFIIGTKTGEWRHFDFGNEYWRGDCVDLVQQIYGCNYMDALKIIDKEFKLGICTGQISKSRDVITWKKPVEIITPPPFFQVITKRHTKEMLSWWNQYHQDLQDLKRENIYCPSKIYRNRKLLPLKESLLTFCYYEETTDSWKLYRPNGKSGKNVPTNERKWDSNIKFDVVEGLSNINSCETAIVSKARKDSMVLKKALGTNCCCNVQAEDPACMTSETIQYIKNNSKSQVITSDSDKKGVSFSWWLTKEHDFRHCNVPYNTYDHNSKLIKDFADWAKFYGIETVTKHFKNKGII